MTTLHLGYLSDDKATEDMICSAGVRIPIGRWGSMKILKTWQGDFLGVYWITAQWATPRSYVSSTMYQVYAVIHEQLYTGRSAGIKMCYSGKLVSKQPVKTAYLKG